MKQDFFNIDPALEALVQRVEQEQRESFDRIDRIAQYNSWKVQKAFSDHRVSESHFAGTTGYGYGDRGRDTLEKVFAQLMGAEDSIIRHNFVSGTNAIATALFGVLRPGDVMLSLTGKPYDTLDAVLTGENVGSLKEFGIHYRQLELLEDGSVDFAAIPEAVKGVKMAYIQRSRGYTLRPSLFVEEIEKIAKAVKAANPAALVVVDNCYGEFVQTIEPTMVGADLMMGSLIKNPGGGIAQTGGYIAGRHDLVELCAHRMTSPGVGREVGCSLGESKNMYMGLFFAPTVVASALKTAVLAAGMMQALGYRVLPEAGEPRADIIQTVVTGSPQGLSAFCRGIQLGAPIDAFVTPEAWDMPGYDSPVIMAAGAFHMGASIELSADGPMREPYAAWMQGGLTYPSGKIGVLLAAQSMLEAGLASL
ncbi:methionine gamma-lyase family protein [Oscillospiraceae bacterium MB08-C2-2]|nr:methionine gamma-lyase family protein [Oscillospiraceae bacterium MB08-C2-2]